MKTAGRPKRSEKHYHFEQLCEWMEQEPIEELHKKMIEMAQSNNVYSTKWLKAKLTEKYKNHVFFAEMQGRSDIVCFRDFTYFIVNKAWYKKREDDPNKESERIISTAAKLILAESEYNPLETEIADIKHCEKLLPANLRKFLQVLVKGRLKKSAIGQSIINCGRPRSAILPIPFGLGVEMDNMFGSRSLVDELSKLGFSIS